MEEVKNFIADLEKMILGGMHKYVHYQDEGCGIKT